MTPARKSCRWADRNRAARLDSAKRGRVQGVSGNCRRGKHNLCYNLHCACACGHLAAS